MIIEINEKYLDEVFKKEIVRDLNWQKMLKHVAENGSNVAISYHCKDGDHCHHNHCAANFVKDCDYPNCVNHIRKVIIRSI